MQLNCKKEYIYDKNCEFGIIVCIHFSSIYIRNNVLPKHIDFVQQQEQCVVYATIVDYYFAMRFYKIFNYKEIINETVNNVNGVNEQYNTTFFKISQTNKFIYF